MVMKYYGMATPNVQRGILPLFEAGVDTEKELKLVKVNLMARQNQQPIFKSKHPFGVVPYFEDGDIGIFESRAVGRYIAEKYADQGTPLLGKTPKERATINQWVEAEAQNFQPAAGPMLREMFLARAFQRPVNEEIIKECLTKIGNVLDVYEAQLAKGNKYLAGDKFSLADAFHTPYLEKVTTIKPEVLENRPHVAAWVKDITSRPAFQKCLKMDWENAPVLE